MVERTAASCPGVTKRDTTAWGPQFSDPKNVLEGNNGRKCALGISTCPAPGQPHRQ